jgi:hypothetical protein
MDLKFDEKHQALKFIERIKTKLEEKEPEETK